MGTLSKEQKEFITRLHNHKNSDTLDLDIYQKFELLQLTKQMERKEVIVINSRTQDRLNDIRRLYIDRILK